MSLPKPSEYGALLAKLLAEDRARQRQANSPAELKGIAGYQLLPANRSYSSDDQTRRELAALAEAAAGSKIGLTRVLEVIADVVDNHNADVAANNADPNNQKWTPLPPWRKQMPPEDTGKLPPWPVDPVGQRVRNPHLPLPPLKPGETTPHFDYDSQKAFEVYSPRLAQWARECAKNGGEPSMAMLDRLDAERIEGETLRKLWSEYDAKAWAENKCRPDLAATLTERAQFETAVVNENPWLLKIHRAEAAAGAARGLFDSLTFCSKLAKRDPAVREIHRAAGEILKARKAEQAA